MNTNTATHSDIDVLTALNRDYIQSVQDGDVRRFDEILADDFLCSNPDGSLVDKKQFLAQTARPVTISGLTAEDVKVRIIGDVAIIHARTSYTTADGAQRYGRYTDVWARRNGRWLAVSAHVAIAGQLWGPLVDRARSESRHIYSEGTPSGTAAPQASVSSRNADCQFRATMSCAQFRN